MNIASLTGITSDYLNTIASQKQLVNTEEDFQSFLDAAVNMLNETNQLEHNATAAELEFSLGLADNPHDMQVAANKALTAIQYTTAVRDKILEAYREIMNMQI